MSKAGNGTKRGTISIHVQSDPGLSSKFLLGRSINLFIPKVQLLPQNLHT